MAQDKKAPLYTLYESLKADNYDVPDTYESFERTLTASGKEGTTNRLTLYKSLKSDNYDVPDTYESFANTLFAPAEYPNAPAGAPEPWKPTAEQMARPAEIVSNFSRTSNASMDNLRRKTSMLTPEGRKQAQFAKLKAKMAGTDTPLLGMTPAVAQQPEANSASADGSEAAPAVKDQQGPVLYDVVTDASGKRVNQYMLSDGSLTTDPLAADNAAYEARVERNRAANMTITAQLRRAYKELEDLNRKADARLKEIDGEGLDKPSVLSSILSGGDPMTGAMDATSSAHTQRRLGDSEYQQYRQAIREVNERIQTLESRRHVRQGGDHGFWRSLGQVVGDLETWVGSPVGFLEANAKMSANAVGGSESAQALMGAIRANEKTQAEYGDFGFWSRAGVMTGEMLPFMIDFGMMGGSSSGASSVTRGLNALLLRGIHKAAPSIARKKAVQWTVKVFGSMPEDLLVRAPLMANTVQGGKTAADIVDRKVGSVRMDDNGTYDFSNDKTWGSAIWQGEANAAIENYSEMFGTHLDGALPALAKVFGGKRISGLLARADASAYGRILDTTRKQFERLGVSDYLGEVGEEYYGQLWRTMLNLDDAYTSVPVLDEHGKQVLDAEGKPVFERKNLLETGQFHGDILGGMALSMGVLGAGKYGLSTAAYCDMKHRVNKADKAASALFQAGTWDSVRERIDGTPNENIGKLITDILSDNGLTLSQRNAALDYVESSLNLRGFNLGEVARHRGSVQEPTEAELDKSYYDGYEAATPQEMIDVQNMYEFQRQRIVSELASMGNEDIEDILSRMEADPVGVLRADMTPAMRGIVLDYLNAKTVRDGMLCRVEDDIDEQVAQSNAMVDSRVNSDTGLVHPAVMSLDDRQVYIVGGSIAVLPDGTIDREASDRSIVVRDAQTGELEFTDPKSIVSVGEAVDPEMEKAAAAENIRQRGAQAAADAMNGTLAFNPGETVSIDDGGGQTQVTIVGPAVDEKSGTPVDGQVVVRFPDGRQTVLAQEQLQSFADAANLGRLEDFERERTAERQQSEDTEAIRPRFVLNDEFTILDQEGNTISGSVTGGLDEDGTIEINTSEPLNGRRVQRMTPAELEGLLDTYNGEPQSSRNEVEQRPKYSLPGRIKVRNSDGSEMRGWLTGYVDEEGKHEYYVEGDLRRLHYATEGELDNILAEYVPNEPKQPAGFTEQQLASESHSTKSDEVTNVGVGLFGKIYDAFKGKAKEAAAFLFKSKDGEARGVFHREEIGDIGLVWGNEKTGLNHIINKHVIQNSDYNSVGELISVMENVVTNGDIILQKGGNWRIEHAGHRVVIARNDDGNFVITAYDNTRSVADKKRSDADATLFDQRVQDEMDGTLVPSGVTSDSEDSELTSDNQISGDKVADSAADSALSRVPVDAEGNPSFTAVDAEIGWEALSEYMEGDEDAMDWVHGSIKRIQGEIAKAEKALEKVPNNGNPAAFRDAKRKAREELGRLQSELGRWQEIKKAKVERDRAEAEQRRADEAARRRAANEAYLRRQEEIAVREETERAEREARKQAEMEEKAAMYAEAERIANEPANRELAAAAAGFDEYMESLRDEIRQRWRGGESERALRRAENARGAKEYSGVYAELDRNGDLPSSLEEYLARALSSNKDRVRWDGPHNLGAEIFGARAGDKIGERRQYSWMLGDDLSFAELVHKLWEGIVPEEVSFNAAEVTDQDVRDAVIELLRECPTSRMLFQKAVSLRDGREAANGEAGELAELERYREELREQWYRGRFGMGADEYDASVESIYGELAAKGRTDAEYAELDRIIAEETLNSERYGRRFENQVHGGVEGMSAQQTDEPGGGPAAAAGRPAPADGGIPRPMGGVPEEALRTSGELDPAGTEPSERGAGTPNDSRGGRIDKRGGESEAEAPQTRLSKEYATDIIAKMEMSAVNDPKISLSPESWQNSFGLSNSIDTPLGKVKMGEGQYQKLVDKKRSAEFGMVVQTLQDPDVVFIEPSEAKEGQATERDFSYVFVKTFIRDGQKFKYYTSVSVQKDGMEVSVSSHIASKTAIMKKLQGMERAYTKQSLLPNSSEWHLAEHPMDVPDLLPTQGKSDANVETSAKTEPQQPNNAVSSDSSLSTDEQSGTSSIEPNGESTVSDRKVTNSAIEKQGSGQESSLQPSDNKRQQTVQIAVEAASAEVNTEPTPAQAEAGNYKKGHVTIGEFDITIENPAGSVRKGVDADGKEWRTTIANAYGYIKGTEGVDGDHIDVFLHSDMDQWNGRKVFVVDQTNRDGSFDEHKVMLGFNDNDEAMTAYLANYDKTWADTHPGLRISETNIEDFDKWVRSSHRKTKPFADYTTVSKVVDEAPVKAEPERPANDNVSSDSRDKSDKPSFSVDGNAEGGQEAYDVAKGLVETAGIEVVEVSDAEATAKLDGYGDARLMGSRTDKKMAKVSEHYAGRGLDANTRAAVDVFSGKADNIAIEVERADGKRRVIMRQGRESKAGTKHSLYRHFETRSNYITADDIAMIPEIIAKGERAVNGKKVTYDYVAEDGTRLRVTTEIADGREEFTNLISNRKPPKSESRQAQEGNTQSSARATNPEVSDAKLENNSLTDKSERGPMTLRTSDGTVYGWTEGGKIYLNRDAMNPETPMHEYTHLWDDMVRRENPELWERGKELMKQTPLWDEVMNDPNYADIRDDEDAVASEAHSRLTGKRGAGRIEEMMKEAAAEPDMVEKAQKFSLLHQLKRWLQDMFKGLKKTLSKWSKKDLRNLTAEDFANLTLRDLAEGLNPKNGDRNLVAVHNLSADKLKEALELGGFPMPSIAITKTGVGHSGFGEISLVFGKSSINPANRLNKVYSGDAWTPTFPSMGYKLNSERTSYIYDRANKAHDMRLPFFRAVDFHPDNYERIIDGRGNGSLVEAFKDDYGAKQLFLYERGNPVEKYEKREVEKYSPEKISLFEKVLETIGEDRLRSDDYETLEPEIKRIVSAHQGKDFDLMKPFVVKALVSGTIRKALDYADNGNTKTETDIAATQAKIDARVDSKEYQAWLEEMFAGVVEKKGIRNDRDMFTPSGESRKWESLYDAVTLDNVVKAMRRQSQKGGEGFFGGSIFGASTKEIKDIEKLRMEAEERIKHLPQEEYDAEKKRIEARLENVSVPSASGSFSDAMDFVDNVKDAVVKSHTADGIYRHLHKIYPNMTMELAEEIADIVKDIQKMSTRYLEAKPQRAVGFEEVRLAVVPEGTPREIVEGLERLGVPVRIYEIGNERQRGTIISQETSERDLRFHAAMSRGRADFDALRDRAVAGRGIVMPGLNEAEVRVVEVPRHDFAGTGKKALNAAEKWAKENIVGTHTATDSDGADFAYTISNDAVEKYVSRSATGKSENIGVHLAALKKLPEIISESVEAEVHADYKKKGGVRGAQSDVNPESLIHRFYGAVNIDGALYRVKTTLREYQDAHRLPLAHSYEVTQIELLEAPSDGVVSNSGEPLAMTPNSSINVAKLLQGVEKSYDPGKKLLDESGKEVRRHAQMAQEGMSKLGETDRREVAEYQEKMPCAPLAVISGVEDVDSEADLSDEAKAEMKVIIHQGGSLAAYCQENKKIYIFADGSRQAGGFTLQSTLVHENAHALADSIKEVDEAFLSRFAGAVEHLPSNFFRNIRGRLLSAGYETSELLDEIFAVTLQLTFQKPKAIERLRNALTAADRSVFDKVLTNLYGKKDRYKEAIIHGFRHKADQAGENLGRARRELGRAGLERGTEEGATAREAETGRPVEQTSPEAKTTADRIEESFNAAVSGELKGKPVEIGRLTQEGREYLEKLSGVEMKEFVSFVLNPSDMIHIYHNHFGSNEKDKGNNIPLSKSDIRAIAEVVSRPERVIFGKEPGGLQRNLFYFLAPANEGAYNLLEVYGDRKGNLTTKTFYKTRKGVSQRVLSLMKSEHLTSVTDGATLSDGTKLPKFFDIPTIAEDESSEERQRHGDGYGAYSDAEMSYANDPASHLMGRNRFGKRRQAEFAARERQRMVARIQELAERMHLDNVEIVTDVSQLEGKRAKAKGFYNKRTGKITIVIPNNVSTIDAEQTLLHEAVAHYGLRQLFGEQFNTFLDNVYQSADESIRRKIAEMAAKNGWDFRTATEEYLASLAEQTDFERADEIAGWWSTIKRLFLDMLEKIGFEGFRDKVGVVLTDNELRYILWRSYENLAEPGRYRSILGEAADVAKQYELKVGNYAERGIEAEYAAEPISEVNDLYNTQIERWISGHMRPDEVITLGNPKGVMRHFLPDKPILLRQKVLSKSKKKHGLSGVEMKNLPGALARPVFVFKSNAETISVLTKLKSEKGENLFVAIELEKDLKLGGNTMVVNDILTIHGRETENVVLPIAHNGTLAWVDKEKGLEWLHSAKSNSQAITSQDLEDASKVVKSFENPTIEEEELFRPGDFSPRDRVLARQEYERVVSSGSYQFQEAVQDSMLGLKKLYQAILGKNTRIEDVAGFENAYLYENRMSSINAGEQHEYFQRFMKPLLEEVGRIAGANKRKRRELTDYLMAKHGLERNEYMRNEAAANGEKTDRDFAGLMGLTGEANWRSAETTAQKWVDDYESSVDTATLWQAVNNATKATLEKIYLSGIISKETYEKILGMYDYYVPLRGWDETTSEQVYGYLTTKDGPLGGSIMKKAHGRSSLADDPIATIGMMADDAIRQGNRNLMKQRFLNFILNHPSDAVSVHDIWLEYDAVTDEWRPVFADVEATDTADEVAQKVEAFEQRMEALRNAEPDKYKKGREAQHIPYKVVKGNLREHQILIKRNGRTFVATINGNPRAAQAINGLTNPDVDQNGVEGNMLKAGTWVNRQLSAFYTTRNPDFVVGNFFRDALYSNCMTWVKESPRYARRFHKNFGKANPIVMRRLLGKWEKGTLNMSNRLESLFYQFMKNGGETGYTNVRDIEGHKRAVAAELKKQGSTGRRAWTSLGMQLDLLNRSAENCARFAAFVTSREFGRNIDRAIYDAKEISVNFNKKGSGGKMVNANGQTVLGKAGSYLGGGGRLLYVFWNAGIQGFTNFGRQAKRHPAKFIAGATALFVLGYVIPMLVGGDGDDDDKNAYYNLPEYIRRSNICFRAGEQWVAIPLPIEFRGLYGLGELAYGVTSGKERYTDAELGMQIATQVSQIMPLDMFEGGGGISPFIPSAAKPFTEAYIMNKGWTGLPVYKDTPFNKNDPEWTKAYASADKHLVSFAKWLNETSGGDDFKKGAIDINPAKIEYLLNGTFGGVFTFPNKVKKSGETMFGDRGFEWRNIPIANRLIKSGDERTANRKLQNEYFKYKAEYENTSHLIRKYENAVEDGIVGYAERVSFLENSPEYARWEIFDDFKADIDAYREEIAAETDEEERLKIETEMYATMRELINALHNPEQYLASTSRTVGFYE